jgi:hypothetical membrane protein
MHRLYIYYTSLLILGVAGIVYSLLNYATRGIDFTSVLGVLGGIALSSLSVYEARTTEPPEFTVRPYGVFSTAFLALLGVVVILFELVN